ncbi:hypothetical protein BO94DRAFT_582264 [Aspergillus sclerotioniger CBS 115572]|uniref:TOG domain-containing protein n=1 Tax=Aspergillus sclerotioniger CBS 115572 TaxID=1450535 RepID=A0A317X8F7_9EURO|nr:hypothetical protein BO94DRAFT_582264 [Aspergillus sclerotioniger CBS 115572]PWY94883.1 hypothetical protein BO94DRAFT_582264 [Aspergillus sclerotioniger CBS 115572]
MSSIRFDITVGTTELALFVTLFLFFSIFKLLFFLATFAFIYALLNRNPAELKLLLAKMEHKAAELVAILKNANLAIDAKVTFLNGVKSDIKQKNVPEDAVPSIFEALRLSIGSQHLALLSAGYSTLGHFLKRLFIQGQHDLVALQGRHLYPLLLERLGDHKERIRAQAAQAFTDIWPAAGREVEQYVLDLALAGKNNRAKEMSMLWLANMTKNHGLLFRSYVPSLVACLEDADSTVRDTAKSTVVDLFQDAPAHAKSDLRRQMSEQKVRKSIVHTILANIGLDSDEPEHLSRPASRVSQRPASRASQRPVSRASRSESIDTVIRHLAGPVSPQKLTAIAAPDTVTPRLPRPVSPQKTTASAAPDTVTQRLPRPVSPQKPTASAAPDTTTQRLPRGGKPTAIAAPDNVTPRLPRPVSPQKPTASAAPDTTTQRLPQGGKPTASAAPPKSTPGTILQEDENVEPLIVSSSRELDNIFRTMIPYFEGRESEDNWMHREKSVLTLRRLLHGNAPQAYPQPLMSAIKSMLDGIFKAVNSLRTTLGANGCLLVQDIATQCGPSMDSSMEIIMQNLIKLCASMKKITAQNGYTTVDIVIGHVSFTQRILQHITSASLDKNVQLRLYSAGWMKTLITKQASNKASIEHGGGLELIEKGLKKGLSDANPDVRQAMRRTFWTFYNVWPIRAQAIMSDLDVKSRSLLEKDPANPNVEHANTDVSKTPAKPPRSVAALKEAIAAHKKKYYAPKQALPPRPESSSSHVSSLSSAPMRPAAKKPQPAIRNTNEQTQPVIALKESEDNSLNQDITTVLKESEVNSLNQNIVTASKENKVNYLDQDHANIWKENEVNSLNQDIVTVTKESEANHLDQDHTTAWKEREANHLDQDCATIWKESEANSLNQDIVTASKESEANHLDQDHITVWKEHEANHLDQDCATIWKESEANHLDQDHTTVWRESEANHLNQDHTTVWTEGEASSSHKEEIQERSNENDFFEQSCHPTLGLVETAEEVTRPTSQKEVVDSPSESTPSKLDENQDSPLPPLRVARTRRVSVSLRAEDYTTAARRNLENSIPRILSRDMDLLGYHKLQRLIQFHDRIYDEEDQYMVFLNALLAELERAPEAKQVGSRRLLDYKTQVLATVKCTFQHLKKLVEDPSASTITLGGFCTRILKALVRARMHYEGSCYLASGMAKMAEEVIAQTDQIEAVDTLVLMMMDEDLSTRSLAMGFTILTTILRRMNTSGYRLPPRLVEKVGGPASRYLTVRHSEVRQQATQLAVQLRKMTPNEGSFWKLLGEPNENSRKLLTYYIAKG